MPMSISQKRSGMFAITVALISSLLLALTSCSSNSQDLVKINLAPAPYTIQVPSEIAKHLSIENMAADTANGFSAQAKAAGAIAQVRINYTADDGSLHGFAGVYYFAKADFESGSAASHKG